VRLKITHMSNRAIAARPVRGQEHFKGAVCPLRSLGAEVAHAVPRLNISFQPYYRIGWLGSAEQLGAEDLSVIPRFEYPLQGKPDRFQSV
jgi:hypothetical protein